MTGTELREIRLSLGIDQTTLAALLGCLQHHVSRWESGTVRMSRKYIDRILYLQSNWDTPEIQAEVSRLFLATL